MFDVKKIREDFPIYANQPDLIYFDNGATTLKPKCVIDAVSDFYCTHTSNVHRGDYAIAAQNDRLYDGTRKIFARMINCEPDEIAFVHNVTAALNQIAYGLSDLVNEGDVILVSKAEHASNLLPWFRLAKQKNAKLHIVGYADSATGNAAYNQKLSLSRAQAIADELVKMGVNKANLSIEGKGGVATLDPASFNRRVIIEAM
jgi:cysteine desulfurase/selenocysteine lyase